MIRLEKWYCDFLQGDEVHINYLSTLKIAGFGLGFEGNYNHAERNFRTKLLPGNTVLPTLHDADLSWPGNTGPSYHWHKPASRQKVLHDIGGKRLTWNPLILNGTPRGLNSRGYVEQLVLEFAPWKLGLTELYWGRFCGQKHSLVWIQWNGEIDLKLLLADGFETELNSLSEKIVVGANGWTLEMSDHQVVFDESIGNHIFGGFPFPKWSKFGHFLAGQEKKQAAIGVLFQEELPLDNGNVILEKIAWP